MTGLSNPIPHAVMIISIALLLLATVNAHGSENPRVGGSIPSLATII
jgi:hypothetical protein